MVNGCACGVVGSILVDMGPVRGERVPAMSNMRLTKKGQRTRQSILSSAKRVFGASGYSHTRITDIAENAGISLGAVYRYFENKDDIFGELFDQLHAQFLEVTRTRIDPQDLHDLYRSIKLANVRYFELYASERGFMRAVVEASAVSAQYLDRWSAMYEEITNRFLRRLSEFTSSTDTPPNLDRRVFALVCMTEQVAYVNFTWRSDETPIQPTELAEVVTEIWIKVITRGEEFTAGLPPNLVGSDRSSE